MPYVIAATIVVIFLFLSIAFKSVLVAVRSVLTVTLTMAWIFGFVYLIYTVSDH